MGIVDFDLFKQHVRSDDFSEDDALLRSYLKSAEGAILRSVNRTEEELIEIGGGEMPPQLAQAIMMLAASWYDNREAVGQSGKVEIPYSIQFVIKPLTKLG